MTKYWTGFSPVSASANKIFSFAVAFWGSAGRASLSGQYSIQHLFPFVQLKKSHAL